MNFSKDEAEKALIEITSLLSAIGAMNQSQAIPSDELANSLMILAIINEEVIALVQLFIKDHSY